MIYDSILKTIGRTPIVRINRLAPPQVEMYVKCEFFNPLHSVKDRLAIAIIEDAERSGALQPGQTVVEATSGNTGIALAMVCAAKGYPFVAVMVETFSIERRKVMRMLGAKVILTPAAERGTGMVRKAAELAAKHGWFLARQFENPANPAYHRSTTGPEILGDFAGRRLDFFVTGWGTGGTLTGVGEMLKLARPDVKIVATEPEGAALLSGKPFAPHKIQGWTPDFIPAVLNRAVPDQLVLVTDAEAIAMPDAEYMKTMQLAFFRLKLMQLKKDILNSAGQTTEHLREDTSVVPDPADRATIEEEHALELRTRDRERKLLKKIEQSIARIDGDDYGYCDETGEAIGVARLIARPTASLSLEAQQRRELKQKMFGD